MSSQQTEAFIATVRTLVAEEAFDAIPEEFRDVFLDTFGSALHEGQPKAGAGVVGTEQLVLCNSVFIGLAG
jgi:hypothetical protein